MTDSKKMVTDVFSSLSHGNVAKAEINLTDDFHTTVMNKELNKKQFISAFNSLSEGIPDLQINLHDVEEHGNKIHALMNLSGTHSKEIPEFIPGFKNILPKGKKLMADNLEVEISLKDHKIQEIKNVQTGKGIFNEVYSQLAS